MTLIEQEVDQPFDFKKEFVISKPAAKRFLEGEVSTVDRYFVSGAQR